jgi:hypothetical protein
MVWDGCYRRNRGVRGGQGEPPGGVENRRSNPVVLPSPCAELACPAHGSLTVPIQQGARRLIHSRRRICCRFLEFSRRRETRNFVADITAKLAPLVVPLGNPVSAHFAPHWQTSLPSTTGHFLSDGFAGAAEDGRPAP